MCTCEAVDTIKCAKHIQSKVDPTWDGHVSGFMTAVVQTELQMLHWCCAVITYSETLDSGYNRMVHN